MWIHECVRARVWVRQRKQMMQMTLCKQLQWCKPITLTVSLSHTRTHIWYLFPSHTQSIYLQFVQFNWFSHIRLYRTCILYLMYGKNSFGLCLWLNKVRDNTKFITECFERALFLCLFVFLLLSAYQHNLQTNKTNTCQLKRLFH